MPETPELTATQVALLRALRDAGGTVPLPDAETECVAVDLDASGLVTVRNCYDRPDEATITLAGAVALAVAEGLPADELQEAMMDLGDAHRSLSAALRSPLHYSEAVVNELTADLRGARLLLRRATDAATPPARAGEG